MDDPHNMLTGTGKSIRVISLETLDKEKLSDYINQAIFLIKN